MNFQDENGLLYLLYKQKQSERLNVYPKVSEIPKGKDNTISPDIDLLQINDFSPKVLGYEVKVLRYRKTSNGFPLGEFYKGLGQIMCYFQHGVEQVYLVLGLCGIAEDSDIGITDGSTILDKTEKDIQKTWDFFLRKRFLPTPQFSTQPHVAIKIYRQDKDSASESLCVLSSFSVTDDEDVKYKNECLIRRKFSFARTWLKEMEKKERKTNGKKTLVNMFG